MSEDPKAKPDMRTILEEVISEMVAKGITWPEAVSEIEKLFMLDVLRRHRGNLCKAAHTMGVHRNTLAKKMKEHGIEKPS